MDAATDWVIDGGQDALDFDGSNDTVIVSNTPLTGTSTYSYTISLWFRSNSNAQSAVLIGSGAPWYLAQGFAGANTTGIGFFNGSSNPGATNFINTSRWQMITVSKSGGNLSMYYDGSITYGPAADNNALSTAGFRFGGLAGGFNWSGVIGSCSFHSRGLTAREVAILYNLGPGGMLERRRRRRVYSVQADVVRSYLFTNRGQVIGGGTL
jgi:hypothetical protein